MTDSEHDPRTQTSRADSTSRGAGDESRYIVDEGLREFPDLPACPACGSTMRQSLHLRLGRISVDAFADLCAGYSRKSTGALVKQLHDGYRLIGQHACDCENNPAEPEDTP